MPILSLQDKEAIAVIIDDSPSSTQCLYYYTVCLSVCLSVSTLTAKPFDL